MRSSFERYRSGLRARQCSSIGPSPDVVQNRTVIRRNGLAELKQFRAGGSQHCFAFRISARASKALAQQPLRVVRHPALRNPEHRLLRVPELYDQAEPCGAQPSERRDCAVEGGSCCVRGGLCCITVSEDMNSPKCIPRPRGKCEKGRTHCSSPTVPAVYHAASSASPTSQTRPGCW